MLGKSIDLPGMIRHEKVKKVARRKKRFIVEFMIQKTRLVVASVSKTSERKKERNGGFFQVLQWPNASETKDRKKWEFCLKSRSVNEWLLDSSTFLFYPISPRFSSFFVSHSRKEDYNSKLRSRRKKLDSWIWKKRRLKADSSYVASSVAFSWVALLLLLLHSLSSSSSSVRTSWKRSFRTSNEIRPLLLKRNSPIALLFLFLPTSINIQKIQFRSSYLSNLHLASYTFLRSLRHSTSWIKRRNPIPMEDNLCSLLLYIIPCSVSNFQDFSLSQIAQSYHSIQLSRLFFCTETSIQFFLLKQNVFSDDLHISLIFSFLEVELFLSEVLLTDFTTDFSDDSLVGYLLWLVRK